VGMTDEEIVRATFEAFRTADRAAAEKLYAPGFVFTSPQDDRIDRSTFFEVCFPTEAHFSSQRFLAVVATEPGVLVLYEYQVESGEWYRNAECITVRDGQVVETQVYFGGQVPAPA
jgi:ketosteroid isomerase-like protein